MAGTLALLLASCTPAPVTLTPETPSEFAHRVEAERKHQLQQDAFHPDDAVIFLGDSITAGLAVDAIAPRAVNYGIGGQTTQVLLDALPRYGSVRRARLVVLSIGTVDMVSGRRGGIEGRLQALADGIPVAMAWNAIPPTTKADVREVNAAIRRMCAAKPGCVFVQAPITQADLMGDGVHLLPSGYAKWINSIQQAMEPRPFPPRPETAPAAWPFRPPATPAASGPR